MNLLKTISGLALMGLLWLPNSGFAQGKVTDFKSLVKQGQYGGVDVVIKPLSFDPNQKDYKSYKYSYGVRICYNVKGVKKSARQDMSFDIYKYGQSTYRLAYGAINVNDVRITDIEYFNMEETPRNQWPSKKDCN